MEKTEFLQALTLWFAVVIFLEIEAGFGGGIVITATAIVAIGLVYLLPIYLFIGVSGELLSAYRTLRAD
jgi:L-lactate permease